MERLITFLLIILIIQPIAKAETREYQVKEGDTAESIAKKFSITPEQLKLANKQVRFYDIGVILAIPNQIDSQNNAATNSNINSYADSNYDFWNEHKYDKNKKIQKAAAQSLLYAAENGNQDAQLEYYKRAIHKGYFKYVKTNPVKAVEMLLASAYQGNINAKWTAYSDSKYELKKIVEKYPSLSDILPSENTLDKWYQDALNANNVKALHNEASKNLSLFSKEKEDSIIASKYLLRIMEQGNLDDEYNYYYTDAFNKLVKLNKYLPIKKSSSFEIADSYIKRGLPDCAYLYYLKSANEGNIKSMIKVAEYNSDRNHKSYNLRDAEMWYNKAAEKGNKTAIEKVNEIEKEKKLKSKINSKNNLAKGKSKFDKVMDKIGAVLDTSGKVIEALNNTLTDIEANKSGNSTDHTISLSENDYINSSSDLILVDPLISKYSQACAKYTQKFEKDKYAMGSKYTIKKWNECIEWLSQKKREGNGYISKTVWEEYESNMNRQLDSNHKQIINNLNVIKNDTKTAADNQASRNYSSFASDLKRYHDNPSGTHYNYNTDIAHVRKLQKYMREARARINCKKSKWEDWDGIPGSMK